jgi:hypothetical protein
MKWIAASIVIALVLLHQDFWLWTDHTLVFGFLPVGLAYHIAYCFAASAAMWFLVRYTWPRDLTDPEPANTGEAAP